MISVNFLPYWGVIQKRKSLAFWILCGLVSVIGCFIVFFLSYSIDFYLSQQLKRNEFLSEVLLERAPASKEYDKVLASISFIELRKKAIEELHIKRQSIISFMKDLAASVPEGLFLTSIEYKPSNDSSGSVKTPSYWQIDGYAQNIQVISNMISFFEKSTYFEFLKMDNSSLVPSTDLVSSREKFSLWVHRKTDQKKQ